MSKKFSDFALGPELLDALAAMGFESPSPIQAAAIPVILTGRDVIGQAQTGTGKTAAFGIPAVHRMDPVLKPHRPGTLILVPTRELAEQVAGEINEIGQFKGVHAVAIYGGASFGPQIKELREGVPVVVGTPGRVMDHMRRGNIHLNDLKLFILDEADRMLDMGFIDDIKWVLKKTPRDAQKLLFSATMPVEIMNLASEVMDNPETVAVSEDKFTVEGTEQVYYQIGYRNKPWLLYRILEAEKPDLAFVFCRTKIEVDKVARLLKGSGFAAEALHGDMTQKARNKVMENVRESKTRIVIATDVLARGIDVSHCTHVINYDVPEDPEWYVHRIGRTGRMGKTGKAITFVTREESRALLDIMDVSQGKVRLETVPEPKEAGKKKDKIKKVMDWRELADPTGMVHFRVKGIGSQDGAKMMDLFKAINKKCRFRENTLGHLQVFDDHFTVQVPDFDADYFYNAFEEGKLLDKDVTAEVMEKDDEEY
ncbi:MAG TPA: DEAD/DEAH box helicase [Candidatus Thermoplasmatota archaeon]|nr:DEAD/DEAH box helicase [Candidatus Thermoplasmatota archaeon]